MSKRAVILAGGKGTRLKPYTVVLPKPLMPIGDFPILEVIVRQLKFHGFDRITMAVNHQAEIIKAYFGDGEKWDITIDYSLENQPLSTMGPLKLIDDLEGDFLVMNGDILSDIDYSAFYDNHIEQQNIFTIAAQTREETALYGVLEIDDENKLSGFKEKPTIKYNVSMGIYMLNSEVLSRIPDNIPYGFDNLMLKLIEENNPASVYNFDGRWLDIGRPDDYMQAIEEFEGLKDVYLKGE